MLIAVLGVDLAVIVVLFGVILGYETAATARSTQLTGSRLLVRKHPQGPARAPDQLIRAAITRVLGAGRAAQIGSCALGAPRSISEAEASFSSQ
jgi:hypothetical protein